MSAPIGPGDWVECLSSQTLRVGAIYCVAEVLVGTRWCHCHGESPLALTLVGVKNGAEYVGWCGLNFRPIYRPSESLFLTRLLDVPAPEFEGV